MALGYIRQHHAAIRRAFEDAERWRALKRDSFAGPGLLLKRIFMLDTPSWDAAIDAMQATAPKLHCSSGPETELNLGADARGDNGHG
jgi:hypothetical protein